jgi:pyruvate kinase
MPSLATPTPPCGRRPQVKIVAVGAGYTSFEGYKDESTGETVIGLSYDKLCQHVKPGGRILMADGSLAVEVGGGASAAWPRLTAAAFGRAMLRLLAQLFRGTRHSQITPPPSGAWTPQVRTILGETELVGVALNNKTLGQRKNCNLPGVLVDLPVLGTQDVADVQDFACK